MLYWSMWLYGDIKTWVHILICNIFIICMNTEYLCECFHIQTQAAVMHIRCHLTPIHLNHTTLILMTSETFSYIKLTWSLGSILVIMRSSRRLKVKTCSTYSWCAISALTGRFPRMMCWKTGCWCCYSQRCFLNQHSHYHTASEPLLTDDPIHTHFLCLDPFFLLFHLLFAGFVTSDITFDLHHHIWICMLWICSPNWLYARLFLGFC